VKAHVRPLCAKDEKPFLEMVRGSRNLHHPWVFPPSTAQDFTKLMERLKSDTEEAFLVWPTTGEAPAGYIHISNIVRGHFHSAYLGYWGNASQEGKGWMTLGLKWVVRHAFRQLKLHRLEANIQPDNKRSIALVKRCGFQKEGFSPAYLKIGGRWCDHERWAILRS